jgi:hypothetical protein
MGQQRSRHHKRLRHALISSDLDLLLITANEAPLIQMSAGSTKLMELINSTHVKVCSVHI